ncbi:unnamed protein product [Arabis nemorensis]|uniref:Germin-like protein n=1 Tax=Arabis nemorensis TaxID=586526 RepID=A0A565C5M1_9BRAS|nr:unnamed protein product [Arabis nemorensis]
MKSLSSFLASVSLLALTFSLAFASDPSPVQDFCVGVNTPADGVFVNGKFCKDPKLATPEDFFFTGLDKPIPVTDPAGSAVKLVYAENLPGLNTLGLSFARADFAVNGYFPPHIHPRATEVLVVMEGTLSVGFVSSDDNGNRLFNKTLNKGDLIVLPMGLIHYAVNVGNVPAVALASLNSQNPGMITIANALGSIPPINPNVLATEQCRA